MNSIFNLGMSLLLISAPHTPRKIIKSVAIWVIKILCIFNPYFLLPSVLPFSFSCPRREAGDVWCLPRLCNLRAVIWFHFAISCLVLLPSPVTLSVLSFSACWPFLLNFFQKILHIFRLRDRLFCMAPVLQLGEDSWSVVCAACCHRTLVFAVMHLYNFFLLLVPFFLYTFFP